MVQTWFEISYLGCRHFSPIACRGVEPGSNARAVTFIFVILRVFVILRASVVANVRMVWLAERWPWSMPGPKLSGHAKWFCGIIQRHGERRRCKLSPRIRHNGEKGVA